MSFYGVYVHFFFLFFSYHRKQRARQQNTQPAHWLLPPCQRQKHGVLNTTYAMYVYLPFCLFTYNNINIRSISCFMFETFEIVTRKKYTKFQYCFIYSKNFSDLRAANENFAFCTFFLSFFVEIVCLTIGVSILFFVGMFFFFLFSWVGHRMKEKREEIACGMGIYLMCVDICLGAVFLCGFVGSVMVWFNGVEWCDRCWLGE